MAFRPDGGNIKKQKNTSLVTGNEGTVFLGNLLGGLPGAGIIKNEWGRMMAPTNQKPPDTFLQDFISLPLNLAKGVAKTVVSTVATPALSVYEMTPESKTARGKDYSKLGVGYALLSGQSSYQTQRQQLKNEGAGEIYSDLMPVANYAGAVLLTKTIGDITGQAIKNVTTPSQSNYLKMFNDKNSPTTESDLQPVGTRPNNPEYVMRNESYNGWKAGQKAQFDEALFSKDTTTIQQMLPNVPQYYKDEFASNIKTILDQPAPKITIGPNEPLGFQPLIPGINIPEDYGPIIEKAQGRTIIPYNKIYGR